MTFEMVFILLGIIQIFGFFVEGSAGFGCTVISSPFATSILGVTTAVPFGTIMSTSLALILTLKSLKNISWKDLGKILLACLPGLLVGQYLFYAIDPAMAKIAIGAVVMVIALFKIYQNIIVPLVLKKEMKEEDDSPKAKVLRVICLITGGVVHGAFNIGGQLITVYTLSAVKDKTRFRNTMICFWCIMDTLNAINQFRNGAWTPYLWSAVVVCWPFAAVGFLLGIKFLDKINREQFLRVIYVVLFAVGCNLFVRSLIEVV